MKRGLKLELRLDDCQLSRCARALPDEEGTEMEGLGWVRGLPERARALPDEEGTEIGTGKSAGATSA